MRLAFFSLTRKELSYRTRKDNQTRFYVIRPRGRGRIKGIGFLLNLFGRRAVGFSVVF